jgi:hypothetical protein
MKHTHRETNNAKSTHPNKGKGKKRPSELLEHSKSDGSRLCDRIRLIYIQYTVESVQKEDLWDVPKR